MILTRSFLLRIVARCSSVAVALTLGYVASGRCGSFVAIDGTRFDRLTRDVGFQSQPTVFRNGAGTKLFFTGRMADNTTLVKIVSCKGVALKTFASGRPMLNDDGEVVAWVTNLQAKVSAVGVVKALAFATGEAIPIVYTNASPAVFQFAPGGQYLLLDEPQNVLAMVSGWASLFQPVVYLTPSATNTLGRMPRWQAVLRTSQPTKPLFRLPNDFYGRAIFTRTNQVIVSGFKFVSGTGSSPGRPQLEKDNAWALVFSEDGLSYRLTSQLDLSRFSGVLDLDPTSGTLLVRGKGDTLAEWGLFDPETGSYKSLGRAGGQGFFLDPELSKYLEASWK